MFVSQVQIDGKLFHKYQGELYPDYLHHGNAASFISETALTWCIGQGLDIGSGKWPIQGATPIENDAELNAHKLDKFHDGSLDFVFSSHCLEHLQDWQNALKLWIRKIRPNGILFLYLPHESMKLWNPCGPWVATGHKWKPTLELLLPFLEVNGIEIIEYNPTRDSYWSFHVIGRKRAA